MGYDKSVQKTLDNKVNVIFPENIGISTSGNAKSGLNAVRVVKAVGGRTLALTGAGGGQLKKVDVTVKVPETETYKVQEYHLPVYHYLCAETEKCFFAN